MKKLTTWPNKLGMSLKTPDGNWDFLKREDGTWKAAFFRGKEQIASLVGVGRNYFEAIGNAKAEGK